VFLDVTGDAGEHVPPRCDGRLDDQRDVLQPARLGLAAAARGCGGLGPEHGLAHRNRRDAKSKRKDPESTPGRVAGWEIAE
jgi:hypothetical protein